LNANSPASPGTSWWMRAEHLAIVTIFSSLALMHIEDIAWARFAAAFLLIDLLGYLPGAIAFRRSAGQPIAPAYHMLYNLTHNYIVTGTAIALWALAIGGLEWAMVAVPIHLSGDRALFGNFSKPASLPFEPLHSSRG